MDDILKMFGWGGGNRRNDDDFFRGSFFHGPTFPEEGHSEDKQKGEDIFPPSGFHFTFTEPDDMHRHFDEMFKNFHEMFRSMGIAEFPAIQPPDLPTSEEPSSRSQERSLRDDMLKQPGESHRSVIVPSEPAESQPSRSRRSLFDWFSSGNYKPPTIEKQDKDLDEAVKSGDLETILKPGSPATEDMPVSSEPSASSTNIFRSVSVHTFRSADGKVEERRTVQDGRGNKETMVHRKVGDQEHKVVVKRDKTGKEEVKEDFVNLDEGEKDKFDQRWQTPSNQQAPSEDRNQMLLPKDLPLDRDKDSIFRKLFGFSFPGFPSKD